MSSPLQREAGALSTPTASWQALVPWAVPACMLLAGILGSTLAGSRGADTETLFLAFWAAAVFTPLTFAGTARGALHASLALATTALIAALPRSGGLRPVAVASLLALSVVVLAARALAGRANLGLRTSCAFALAAAFVLHGHRLFLDGLQPSTLVLLALLPGSAAVVATRLAERGRPGIGLAAALVLLGAPRLADEPWWTLLALATAASVASLAAGTPALIARRALFLFAAATLLAGSFPWLRPAPVAALATAVASIDRPVVETPLGERAVVLTPEAPAFEAELGGAAVRALIVDSYLTHGDDLACGRRLATVELASSSAEEGRSSSPSESWRAELVVGRDSADWASGRPDVAARLACPAPPAWISWIPGAGRFLGQTTRSRLALPRAFHGRRLRIERSAELPAATTIALFFVATER
jgi:hypothetical protein